MKALDLHITDKCNLRCLYCSHGISKLENHSYYMSTKELQEIKNTIIDSERTRINVSGGEPTAHPEFEIFCNTLRQLFPNQHLRLMSNGFKAELYKSVILNTFDSIVFTEYPSLQLSFSGWPTNIVDIHKVNHRSVYIPGTANSTNCAFKVFPMVRNYKIYPCCRVFGLKLHLGEQPEDIGLPLKDYKNLACDTLTCSKCWTQNFETVYKETVSEKN